MNIVYITQFLPFPLDTGGSINNFSLIYLLKKLGHKVAIFSFVKSPHSIKYEKSLSKMGFTIGKTIYNPLLAVKQTNKMRTKKIIKFLFNLFSLKPFSVALYYEHAMEKSINNYLTINEVNCVFIHSTSMSQYMFKKFYGLKILYLSDVNSILFKKMMLKDFRIKWKFYALVEWTKSIIYEKFNFINFDKIFTISYENKQQLEKITKKKNVVTLPAYVKKIRSHKNKILSNELLFVGNLCWYPNNDGINWFIKKIYPLLSNQLSNFKISIVGQNPNINKYKNMKEKGLKFFGYRKNINIIWEKAKLFIVPIRYGSGLRVKILEAMTHGIPIVSTYEGATGLNVKNGKELFLTNNEQDFVEKICLLLKDKPLRKKFIKNSYRFLSKYFSEERLRNILEKNLQR